MLGEYVVLVKESLGFSTGDGLQRCSRRGGRGIQNLDSGSIEGSLGAVQRREAFAAGGCGITATAIGAAAATAAGLGSRWRRAEHGVGGSAPPGTTTTTTTWPRRCAPRTAAEEG